MPNAKQNAVIVAIMPRTLICHRFAPSCWLVIAIVQIVARYE